MSGGLDRRMFLKTVGAVGGVGLGVSATQTSVAQNGPEWTTESTPGSNDLFNLALTSDGFYAVGRNGTVIRRTNNGWESAITQSWSGSGEMLFGADVSDDGDHLWIVGTSGVVGEYDVTTGNLQDKSAPNDQTNSFNGVAVMGPGGDSNVYIADGSGNVHYSFNNGSQGSWSSTKPSNASEIFGIDFHGPKAGHFVDGSAQVYETTNGKDWTKIGIPDADSSYIGIDSDATDDVWVCGGNGKIAHYDGSSWNKNQLDTVTFYDIEVEGDHGYTVGDKGTVYDRSPTNTNTTAEWTKDTTDTSARLKSVVRRTSKDDVSVGEAETAISTDSDVSDGGGTKAVDMVNTSFDPHRASVDVGTTVEWTNKDSFQHDVTSAKFHDKAEDWDFKKTVSSGGTASYTFDSKGVYEYYCSIHGKSNMCGVILVGDVSLSKSLPCEDDGGGGNKSIEEAIANSKTKDNMINFNELQLAITYWIQEKEVPETGGKKIDFSKLQELINIWIQDKEV